MPFNGAMIVLASAQIRLSTFCSLGASWSFLENMIRDNRLTVAAIAILAMCAATFAHEAAGHGTACLLLGGRITQLTSVYFDCSRHGIWLPAAGPLGNLVAAALSAIALRRLPLGKPGGRLLLAMILAFSLFWAAGYLLYSAVTGEGDDPSLLGKHVVDFPTDGRRRVNGLSGSLVLGW